MQELAFLWFELTKQLGDAKGRDPLFPHAPRRVPNHIDQIIRIVAHFHCHPGISYLKTKGQKMFHKRRRWGVFSVGSVNDIAAAFTQGNLNLCTGFVLATQPDYLFLNDSPTGCADVFEAAVILGGINARVRHHIHSIVGGMGSMEFISEKIQAIYNGEFDGFATTESQATTSVQPIAKHDPCPYCT